MDIEKVINRLQELRELYGNIELKGSDIDMNIYHIISIGPLKDEIVIMMNK